MPTVNPGDKITTTVKLSQDSDVRFKVLRGLTTVLRTRPGVFEYQEGVRGQTGRRRHSVRMGLPLRNR